MLVKDEVFERLKNGESSEQIRSDYRSSSQFAEGVRMYLVWRALRNNKGIIKKEDVFMVAISL